MIGARLGVFVLEEQLGAGGMGVVYRARDGRLHRDVALKLLPPGSLTDESSRRLFHREALALSRLNHPGIATVHDFQTVDGIDFLVMEYIAGESLDTRLARGAMPPDEVIGLGIQIADALAAAHKEGVVHRDLKPGNLRMTPDGRLKILDFGLAKWRSLDSESLPTITAHPSAGIAGTPAYLAPELLGGATADERSDLWAVGMVLYEAATGARPFAGLPISLLFEAIRSTEPPNPRSKNPAIPVPLESVILRCLAADPAKRYPSASELGDDLRRIQSGARVLAPSARAPGRARVVAGATVVAVAIGIGAWLWQPRDPRAATLRSLAVLPLANLSGDPEQEYIADGMTEELIAQLSHVRSLRVISMTSVMRYKRSRPTMAQIGRELGADGVIEGSVLRSGGRMRATVHLIAASDDDQLWSGQYDGDTSDVLQLQSRAARAIVREIQLRLTPEERARLGVEHAVNSEAYQLYLRGRHQWNKRSDAGIRLAIDYFQQAIHLDSTYALFYTGLSDAWSAAGLYGLIPPPEAAPRARAASARALALDPELSEAHTSLGHILHNYDWDWRGAEQEYLKAIELNPNNAVAHHWYGHLLAQTGRFDAARAELRVARELDPLSLSIVQAGGVNEYFARRYDEALTHYHRAMELDSTSSLLHRATAGVLDRMGRRDEAMEELFRSLALRGEGQAVEILRRAYRAGGVGATLPILIAGLERKRAAGAYEPAEHVAELYARLGDVEHAIQWLETSFREHDTELNRLKVDPLFDPLRSDPRFVAMLARMGLGGAPARL